MARGHRQGADSSETLVEILLAVVISGLVFVGVSINMSRVISYPGLPNRALEALIVLLIVLLVSSLQLVPEQSPALAGSELLMICLCGWIVLSWLHVTHLREVERKHRWQARVEALLGQGATLPFIIAGAIIIENNVSGLFWTLPGIICSFLIVFYNAWILLIEVNR